MQTLRNLLDQKGCHVHTIGPDVPVGEALGLMAERNIGALVVVEEGRVEGLFTERDFARRALEHEGGGLGQPVRAMMVAPARTIPPDRSLEDCLAEMTRHRCRHLPVVEGDTLLGMVSIGDLGKGLLDQRNFVIHQLESYITGAR